MATLPEELMKYFSKIIFVEPFAAVYSDARRVTRFRITKFGIISK